MTESPIHEGGCLCGAVRYRLRGPFSSVVQCHCRLCQRAAGAPLVTWLTLPKADFTVTVGELAHYDSSAHAQRGFCRGCGTQITFWTERYPAEVDVTVASLDEPGAVPPERQIWTRSRLSWMPLDPDLPASAESSTVSGA